MSKQTYRVIQWATGNVGQVAIRHFVSNPVFELVGVLVTNPDKVGKDAGEIAGIGRTGVIATDNVEAIVAMEADCVHFAPLIPDLEMVCRLLRSGKNVVTPMGPFYPTLRFQADIEKLKAACAEGGTSFHGSGIHPGFAGDLLPLTLTRLEGRIDRIHVYEVVDYVKHPSKYIEFMGFGRNRDDLLAKPCRSPEAVHAFAQSMTLVAEGLGKKIDNVTTELELATATKDIAYTRGVISAGTVAGQRYEWTAWADGAPLITFHTVWMMGDKDIDPLWNYGESGYRIVIEGDPPTELILRGGKRPAGSRDYSGLGWTALCGVNVIPDVCDAKPGLVTHLELGVVRPRGLVRRA